MTIVRASLKKGVSVNAVAKLYGVNPSQVYEWRKRARQAPYAKAASLLPVQVADAVVTGEREATPTGSVLIEAQAARVTITGPMEVSVLRTILECLVR
jgi:transposase-like protein